MIDPSTDAGIVEMARSSGWRAFLDLYAARASGGAWRPYPFAAWLAQVAQDVATEPGGRLIVCVPPRHGKSEIVARWLPTWALDWFPTWRVILATHSARFASSWGRKVRDFFEDPNTIAATRVRPDARDASDWYTTLGGGMFSVGVLGAVAGRGADLVIVDDPFKNWQDGTSATIQSRVLDWFESTLLSRCEPNASVLVVHQRWHRNDLAGRLLDEHPGEWRVVEAPARAHDDGTPDALDREPGEPLCPERFDDEALDAIETAVGPTKWAGPYQQRPTAAGGVVFRRETIGRFERLPASIDEWGISLDCSFKGLDTSSFVALGLFARAGLDRYLVDLVRRQMGFTETLDALSTFTRKHPQARLVLVEDKANGTPVLDVMRKQIAGLVPYSPTTSKENRAIAVQPEVEAGHLLIPVRAAWAHDYLEEMGEFPNYATDDLVDMTTQILLHWSDRGGRHWYEDFLR